MEKFLLAALAALSIGGGLAVADTTPASAATPGCVTRAQWRSLDPQGSAARLRHANSR